MTEIAYTIYSSDYISVIYHPETKIVHHTFHKAMPGSELRAALNAGTNFLRRYGVTKWLSDERQNRGLAPEDVQYQITDWAPRTAKAGWKYWAIVVPQSFEGKADIMSVVQASYDLGIRSMVFTTVQEALDWLISL